MILQEPHTSFVKTKTVLYRDMKSLILKSVQSLIDTDLLHPDTNGPRADEIEKALGPYDPEDYSREIPEKIRRVVSPGLSTGVALEALGDWDSALLWYRAGRYCWRLSPTWQYGDLSSRPLSKRIGVSMYQEGAGRCCALAGDVQNADKLLKWAAENRNIPEEDIPSLEKEANPQTLWQEIGFQISSLAWLGEWERILYLSEIGKRAVEKTRRGGYPKDFREPQLLIDIGRDLATYFTSPSDETFENAKRALYLKNIPDRDPNTRFNLLAHLLAFTRRYPELDPYPKYPPSKSGTGTTFFNLSSSSSLSGEDFQQELDRILSQAHEKGERYIEVNSIDLHHRVGGYPGYEHKMDLCHEVMKKNKKKHDTIYGEITPGDQLRVKYLTDRKAKKNSWW
jgi:hypothetical protein